MIFMKTTTITYTKKQNVMVTSEKSSHVGTTARDHNMTHQGYLLSDVFKLQMLTYKNEKITDMKNISREQREKKSNFSSATKW